MSKVLPTISRWWIVLAMTAGVVLIVTALQQRPVTIDDANAAVHRARRMAEAGDIQSATEIVQNVLESDSNHDEALLLLGQLQWNQKQPSASELWQRIPDSSAVAAKARYFEGSAYLDQRNTVAAESHLRRAVELQPQFLAPLEMLTELFAVQRRASDLRWAITHIEQCRPLSPRELAMDVLAGGALHPPEPAIAYLDEFLRVNSDDTFSLAGKAWFLRDQGQYEDAFDLLRDCEMNSACTTARLTLARDLGNTGLAARITLDVNPEDDFDVETLHALGAVLCDTNQYKPAVNFLAAAIKQGCLHPSAYQKLALSLQKDGSNAAAGLAASAAAAADELERDAYLVLRGHPSPQLMAEKMRQVASHLAKLGQTHQAKQWRRAASVYFVSPTASEDAAGAKSDALFECLSSSPSRPTITDSVREVLAEFAADAKPRSSDSNTPVSAPLPIRFADQTLTAGLEFQYENGGTGKKLIIESIGGGVGVIDFDADGWPDLFFPQGGSLPGNDGLSPSDRGDKLFRNRGDGTFQDVTEEAGIDDNSYGLGCTVSDFDNDGDADIFVANAGTNLLWINNGDATFTGTWLPESSTELSASIGVADFNGDGNGDLFVVNYVRDWHRLCQNGQGNFSTCMPIELPAAPDQILVNSGTGSFVIDERSIQSPAVAHRGLGLVTQDFDGDGRCDVYVANDGTANQLFLNSADSDDDHYFQLADMAMPLGCAVSEAGRTEAGMGIAVGDFDNNGLADIFVTNFYQEANRLYLMSESGTYVDSSTPWKITASSLSWLGFGVQTADWNLDGFADLFVTNGDIDDYSHTTRPWKMPSQVFAGAAGSHFVDVSESAGDYFQQRSLGRGVATIDYNRDGLMDIVVVHQDRPATLLKNESQAQPYFSLKLAGVISTRDAVATQATLQQKNRQQTQWRQGSHGFMSSNDTQLIFAIPATGPPVKLEVKWPTGDVFEVDVLNIGEASEYLLNEGRSLLRRLP